jgi:hypothetical protein
MVTRLAILDTTTPELTRSRRFPIENISNGFTGSQLFDVREGALDGIVLDGEFSGECREAVLEARLIELEADGREREVRQGLHAASRNRAACCEVRFSALPESAGKRYRLDLRTRDFDASLRLSLAAETARGGGGLTINGRPQSANLRLEPSGASFHPLRNAPRVSLWWLMLGCAVIDGAVGLVLHSLITAKETRAVLTASGPRRS